MGSTVTPLDTAQRALRDASSEALLDTIVRLTHTIHGIHPHGPDSKRRLADLREQRALVRAEVLRRIPGGAR